MEPQVAAEGLVLNRWSLSHLCCGGLGSIDAPSPCPAEGFAIGLGSQSLLAKLIRKAYSQSLLAELTRKAYSQSLLAKLGREAYSQSLLA